jgi:hypothetical protein
MDLTIPPLRMQLNLQRTVESRTKRGKRLNCAFAGVIPCERATMVLKVVAEGEQIPNALPAQSGLGSSFCVTSFELHSEMYGFRGSDHHRLLPSEIAHHDLRWDSTFFHALIRHLQALFSTFMDERQAGIHHFKMIQHLVHESQSKDSIGHTNMKAIRGELVTGHIGVTRRVAPDLVLIVNAQRPTGCHPILSACSRRQRCRG